MPRYLYRPSLSDQLVPLDLAVRQVFRRVYRHRPAAAPPQPERLDAIAQAWSRILKVYSYDPRKCEAHQLRAEEIAGAVFRKGAQELFCAMHERPAIRNLAVLNEELILYERQLKDAVRSSAS